MDEVVLHIGTHKTGTTSIQNALSKYDDGETIYADLGHQNHSMALYTAFSESPESYHVWRRHGFDANHIESMKLEFLGLLKEQLSKTNRRRFIISGEDISVLTAVEKGYLVDFFSSMAKKITVVCYVRSPSGFAASAFQQRVKGGKTSLPRLCSPQYKLRLEAFRVHPRVQTLKVKEFSRTALPGGDVVQDFINEFGLEGSLIEKTSSNESMGVDAVKVLHNFNRSMPLSSGDSILVRARNVFNRDIASSCSSKSIDKRWVQCLVDFSEQDYVRDNFGLDFSDCPSSSGASRGDLENYIKDLSDVDLSGIDRLLREIGIAGNFPNATDKTVRLFLWRVYEQQLRESRREKIA
ncbi:hypothetical protein [Mangrovicoccus sp. HB161399]|uniref:hypothetical protein n=1 Tax=Mangrovicoccus sp. HB161399 TaxID=2720392 RepID=UPI0015540291|nr:hypothetical protein [Mangrovicoccus sp. HB161399]